MRTKLFHTICGLFILLFSYTAVSKGVNMDLTLYEMRNQPFPRFMSDVLAYALPLLEAVVVVMLLFGRTKLWGLYIATVLMAIFTLYVTVILLGAFQRVPCSCGGVIGSLGWTAHLWLNLFFLIIGIVAIRWYKHIHA